jgi:putative transposase
MRHNATCRDTTIHHLIARGNNRQSIFLSPPDQEDFLARLGHVIARYEWTCLAYCLMGNHFHLVVDSDVWHVPNGMRDLMSGFARAANRRAERTGHLFQERHKAIPIRNDAHLFSTIAYVLNNPVRARIIESPEKWPWSNCAALLGLAPEARS